jgi:hypothetical protein
MRNQSLGYWDSVTFIHGLAFLYYLLEELITAK